MADDIKTLGLQLIKFSGKRDVKHPSPIINAGATMIHGVTPNIGNLDLALAALELGGAQQSLVERVAVLRAEVYARESTSANR